MKSAVFGATLALLLIISSLLTSVQLVNAYDSTPPVLVSFDFSPKTVDVRYSSQTVIFTLRCTDDLSGVWYGYVSVLDSSSSYFSSFSASLVSGTYLDGVWQGGLTIPQGAQPGTWTVNAAVVDNAHLQTIYQTQDLANLGFPATIQVTSDGGPSGDCGRPELISPVRITSKAGYSVGDTLTAKFTVRNSGNAAIHLDKLVLGGRFNGGMLPSGVFPDFTYRSITLQPGQEYPYEGALEVTEAGNYNFFVAYYIANPTEAEKQLLDSNNWNTCIDLASGLTDSDRTWNGKMRIYGIAPDFRFLSDLQYGDDNPRVRYLQIMLNSDPYTRVASSGDGSPGSETCKFDAPTMSAVKKFQEKHSVPITGYVGPLTRTKLNEILAQKFSQQVKTEFGLLDLEQRKATIWSDVNVYIDELVNDVRRYPYLGNFPEELVLAIACVESGDYSVWNNEHVSFDWGRGIMQITYNSLVGAGGVDSSSDDCLKCRDRTAKVYCSRYYSNTLKGIEANIKDALYALDSSYGEIFRKGRIIPPSGYSTEEVIWISTAQRYNCYNKYTYPIGYVKAVGEALLNLANGYYGSFDGFDNALATSLGNKFIEAYRNSGSFRIYSPGELRVYDLSGNVTGVVNGEIREEIPNSFFDNTTGTVITFFPTAGIYCEIEGNETATYDLEVLHVDNGTETAFNAIEITTSLNATHEFEFNWTALSHGEEGVAVQVDSDGDGVFEYAFASDSELTRREYVTATNKYDIGIIEMVLQKTVIGEGYDLPISTTVVNYGAYSETLNVTLYINETSVEIQAVTLSSGNFTTLTFALNTSSVAKGNYIITVVIDTLPGETYTLDNSITSGTVTVANKGDINADGIVDIFDIAKVALAFSSTSNDPNWNPVADINGDEIVDIFDIVVVALHFGEAG